MTVIQFLPLWSTVRHHRECRKSHSMSYSTSQLVSPSISSLNMKYYFRQRVALEVEREVVHKGVRSKDADEAPHEGRRVRGREGGREREIVEIGGISNPVLQCRSLIYYRLSLRITKPAEGSSSIPWPYRQGYISNNLNARHYQNSVFIIQTFTNPLRDMVRYSSTNYYPLRLNSRIWLLHILETKLSALQNPNNRRRCRGGTLCHFHRTVES